jgi:hypothetical protein
MIDMLANEPHFVDHLAAVWKALPPEARGYFMTADTLGTRAMARGVSPTHDQSGDGPILVASKGDLLKARRMGRGPIAYMEHGIGQSYGADPKAATHGSYPGGRDRGDVGLFLAPNEHSAQRWRDAYPTARVEVVGSPKLDRLPAKSVEGGPPVVALSFHFDCELTQESRSTFAYYKNALPALAERFRLIGHGHPRDFERVFSRWYRRFGIEPVEDFEDVCRFADLYVCDNSSTLYEFAATGRPVVVLNEPPGLTYGRGYRTWMQHGLRFWEAADVGLQCDRPDELGDTIERALADPFRARRNREAALDLVYAYRTGAGKRAADALMAWAGERIEVAA